MVNRPCIETKTHHIEGLEHITTWYQAIKTHKTKKPKFKVIVDMTQQRDNWD